MPIGRLEYQLMTVSGLLDTSRGSPTLVITVATAVRAWVRRLSIRATGAMAEH